jgi:hypothetical protein
VRGWLWRNCHKAHGQSVSRVYREVLSVLLSFAVKYGKAYPSHATIAKLACCCEGTVPPTHSSGCGCGASWTGRGS